MSFFKRIYTPFDLSYMAAIFYASTLHSSWWFISAIPFLLLSSTIEVLIKNASRTDSFGGGDGCKEES